MSSTSPTPLPPKRLVLASRKSALAMWQAEHVRNLLKGHSPHCEVEILGMTTEGDRILDRTLAEIGGKGLFVKELELALLDRRAIWRCTRSRTYPWYWAPSSPCRSS